MLVLDITRDAFRQIVLSADEWLAYDGSNGRVAYALRGLDDESLGDWCVVELGSAGYPTVVFRASDSVHCFEYYCRLQAAHDLAARFGCNIRPAYEIWHVVDCYALEYVVVECTKTDDNVLGAFGFGCVDDACKFMADMGVDPAFSYLEDWYPSRGRYVFVLYPDRDKSNFPDSHLWSE